MRPSRTRRTTAGAPSSLLEGGLSSSGFLHHKAKSTTSNHLAQAIQSAKLPKPSNRSLLSVKSNRVYIFLLYQKSLMSDRTPCERQVINGVKPQILSCTTSSVMQTNGPLNLNKLSITKVNQRSVINELIQTSRLPGSIVNRAPP